MGVAQDWANNNAARGMMYHSNHPNDCENIFATSGNVASGRTAADCFYSEIKDYRFGGMGFTMKTGKPLIIMLIISLAMISFRFTKAILPKWCGNQLP